MRHDKKLTTLQARTILSLINKDSTPLTDRETIMIVAHDIIEYCMNNYPTIYNTNDRLNYLSFALAMTAQKAIKLKLMSCLEYVKLLAIIKRNNETELNDYGAFGDLYEILIRIALIKSINLIKPSTLAVRDIMHSDIISKKFGILEVGHNGKTFAEGTADDFMNGSFTSIIYGVFSDDDKKEIYELCENGQIEKAVSYIKEYSVYWSNKYEFLNDMNNLTRGKGVTLKSGKVMTQYNTGKYNAFVGAIEDGTFKSLDEIL